MNIAKNIPIVDIMLSIDANGLSKQIKVYAKYNEYFVTCIKTNRTRRHQTIRSLLADVDYFRENRVLPRAKENWS